MYTGNNKIALQSQEMITQAFIQLLEEKPFNKISISELCNKAMVSRQTFYSLFDSKENILCYEYQKYCLNLSVYFNDENNITIPKLVHIFIQYISQHSDFFSILINNNLTEILSNGLKKALLSCDKLFLINENLKNEYAIAFISGALVEITSKYIKDGETADLNKIEELLISLFEGKYFSL